MNKDNINAVTLDTLHTHTHTGILFNQLLNNITLGDSYKIIKQIPDNSIDLIIIDPPYLIENTNGGTRSRLAKSIRGMNTEIEEKN